MKKARMKLVEVILSKMVGISKPQVKFLKTFFDTMAGMPVKINFASLSRYSGLCEKTFRRWFGRGFDFAEFNSLAIKELPCRIKSIIAVDALFLEKAGKKTHGLELFWNGCNARVEKGLEFSAIAVINVEANTAYALVAKQTLTARDIKLKFNDEAATRVDLYLDLCQSYADQMRRHSDIIAADSFYVKKKFVDGIVNLGFSFIGKMRHDANLKKMYTGEQRSGRGRPRKFAGKCNTKGLDDFTFAQTIDSEIALYESIVYHASLERKIKVVKVVKQSGGKTHFALLFSTNPSLSAHDIYTYYKARFQIEFLFRDAQQFAGMNDFQSRQKESIDFHVNASIAIVTLAKIQAQLDRKNYTQSFVFSMATYVIKNYNESFIGRFFTHLELDQHSFKSHPGYTSLLHHGLPPPSHN